MKAFILALALLLSRASASSSSSALDTHRIHEYRSHIPHGWTSQGTGRLSQDEVLPIRIALTQSNLDKLNDYVMEVSHPESTSYSQQWSASKVAATFAPSKDTVDAVSSWLYSHDIYPDRVTQSASLGWLHLDLTVEEAENLLKTKYNLYKHESGVVQVACEHYHVPEEIATHVDFITPTVHFDAKIGPVDREKVKRDASSAAAPVSNVKAGQLFPDLHHIYDELKHCSQYITPDCLRALYSIPPVNSNVQKNPLGIVEYTPQAYLQSDLGLFFANFSTQQRQRTPIFDSIDGGVLQTTNQSFEYNGESDLDLEYSMTLVNPIPVTLYQAGDIIEGASFNNFLDAIDRSYCTFEGGDAGCVLPRPQRVLTKVQRTAEAFAATKVISTSYAYNEYDLTPFYTARQCAEYAKLGLQGVSVMYSSGDYGAAGNFGQCVNPKTLKYNKGNTGRFNPSFPGTCPWINSVGATQVIPSTDLLHDFASRVEPEQACETVVYSGGGFSDFFAMPDYQRSAVTNYLTTYPPLYTRQQYNNSGTSRGFPDVSANGANYAIAIDGIWALVYGTSASTPTFASIITIINEYRALHGKSSVGFLNPALYAHPYVMNDIEIGTNQGCGTAGFSAEPGWDPVTGLGTPNAQRMLDLFFSLP